MNDTMKPELEVIRERMQRATPGPTTRCATCKGWGDVPGAFRYCPDCNGSGSAFSAPNTGSIPVSFDDVLMSGTVAGPEVEGDRPVAHRRRESILAGIACLVLPVPVSFLVLAVVLHVRGLL